MEIQTYFNDIDEKVKSSLEQELDTDAVTRDLDAFQLIQQLKECQKTFQKLKHNYGDQFCNNLPLDQNILIYLNNEQPKKKKQPKEKKEKTYGKDSNNHGMSWEDKDKLILHDMFDQDKKLEEIAEYLGRTHYSIECMLIHEGMTDTTIDDNNFYYIKKPDKTQKSWSIKEVKKLLEYYNNDVSTQEIATKISESSNLRNKKNKLTEDDVIDKLLQLGVVEIDED